MVYISKGVNHIVPRKGSDHGFGVFKILVPILLSLLFISVVQSMVDDAFPGSSSNRKLISSALHSSTECKHFIEHTEHGRRLVNSMSFLDTIIENVSDGTMLMNANVAVVDDKIHRHQKELHILSDVMKNHPKVLHVIEELRSAIHVLYPETLHIQELEEQKDVLDHLVNDTENQTMNEDNGKNITKHNFLHFSQQGLKQENLETDQDLKTESEIVKDAIVLDNMLKIINSVKRNMPQQISNSILHDKKLLAERLLRDDLELDDDTFRNTHFGIENVEEVPELSLKFLHNFNLRKNVNPSFVEFWSRKTEHKRANYCNPYEDECDRRLHPKSCESRFRIENQGSCAICWAFSGIQYLAISHCIETGENLSFSVQHILDCAVTRCQTGSFSKVINYLNSFKRLSKQSDYPYEGRAVQCREETKKSVWTGLFGQNNEPHGMLSKWSLGYNNSKWSKLIKKFISAFGSVIWYMNAEQFRYTQGEPLFMCNERGKVNHAVLITGWKLLNNVPVWIMRNSWGTWWGDGGYGYVAINNNCGPNEDPVALIHVTNITWKDAKRNPEIIETNADQSQNPDKLFKGIQLGGTATLECLDMHHIHVVKYSVESHKKQVVENQPCYKLNVEGICENKQRCTVSYVEECVPDYKLLVIEYECNSGLVSFNCNSAYSVSSELSNTDCQSLCNKHTQELNDCSPNLTKECLYSHVPRNLCSFELVLNESEAGKTEGLKKSYSVDCNQAKSKLLFYSSKKCVKKCKEIEEECLDKTCFIQRLRYPCSSKGVIQA